MSASFPQWEHVAVPLTFFGAGSFLSAPLLSVVGFASSKEHVTTISASFPQFVHLQISFFVISVMEPPSQGVSAFFRTE